MCVRRETYTEVVKGESGKERERRYEMETKTSSSSSATRDMVVSRLRMMNDDERRIPDRQMEVPRRTRTPERTMVRQRSRTPEREMVRRRSRIPEREMVRQRSPAPEREMEFDDRRMVMRERLSIGHRSPVRELVSRSQVTPPDNRYIVQSRSTVGHGPGTAQESGGMKDLVLNHSRAIFSMDFIKTALVSFTVL